MDFRALVSPEKKRLAGLKAQSMQKRMTEIQSQLHDLAGGLQGTDHEIAAIGSYENIVTAALLRARPLTRDARPIVATDPG